MFDCNSISYVKIDTIRQTVILFVAIRAKSQLCNTLDFSSEVFGSLKRASRRFFVVLPFAEFVFEALTGWSKATKLLLFEYQ